jgi:ABC-type nitrate/sulfonate/bicarbonate transport system ATPase subunit
MMESISTHEPRPVVTAVRLSKTFIQRTGENLEVLRNVSLTVHHNQFVCLLGPSGCGKSTFLHIVAGLAQPDSGEIKVETAKDGAKIGYVFQRPRLLNWRTVHQNLVLAMSAAGIDKQQYDERIKHYLHVTQLDGFEHEYPQALSIGMQQRVALARAFIIDPEILLMDEPFGALDELTAQGMRTELIRLWHDDRRTVLFVTHNVMEAIYLADEIHVFSSRPAHLLQSFNVDMPRNRSVRDDRFLKLQRDILANLGLD